MANFDSSFYGLKELSPCKQKGQDLLLPNTYLTLAWCEGISYVPGAWCPVINKNHELGTCKYWSDMIRSYVLEHFPRCNQ